MKKCPEIFAYFGTYLYLSTTGFGSVCPSSNLGSPTKKALTVDDCRSFFRLTHNRKVKDWRTLYCVGVNFFF